MAEEESLIAFGYKHCVMIMGMCGLCLSNHLFRVNEDLYNKNHKIAMEEMEDKIMKRIHIHGL